MLYSVIMMKINMFIHNKSFLSTCCVLGTIPGTGERALPKQPAGVGRGARGCFAVMELPVCSWASA